MQGELGELTVGAAADLLLVDGNPLEDIAVLANSSNIKLVVKHGLLAKVCAVHAYSQIGHTARLDTQRTWPSWCTICDSSQGSEPEESSLFATCLPRLSRCQDPGTSGDACAFACKHTLQWLGGPTDTCLPIRPLLFALLPCCMCPAGASCRPAGRQQAAVCWQGNLMQLWQLDAAGGGLPCPEALSMVDAGRQDGRGLVGTPAEMQGKPIVWYCN